MDLRELKGLDLAARHKIPFRDGFWVVPSQTSAGRTYRVRLGDNLSCECENWLLTLQPCKHIVAARIVCARDRNGKAVEIDTDAVPKRPTYPQVWPAYNLAQRTEKHRFQVLLADLCRNLPELPREEGKPGPRPHLVRDAVFTMAFKVYCTFSARRFSCDLKDAFEKGHTTKVVPGMKACAFFENPAFTPILQDLIVRSSLPLKAIETTFAPDSTGFSTSRFVRWYDEKYGVERSGKDWVKAHAITGKITNIVTAVTIEGRDAGDSPQFKPLVEKTAENFTIKEIPADKAYLSVDNLELVESLGATAYVPFKSNSQGEGNGSVWAKMFHYYSFNREEFLKHYHQRSNSESTFSMLKAKFRDHVRSKTDVAMKNEVLCKFLCHNICVVIQSQCELGIEPIFWPEEPKLENPEVLPMIRPS